ncbi:MAG TPA: hypothetical protein VD913_02715, partial [bacterium]|nr:hypothetical protein [bacterium]
MKNEIAHPIKRTFASLTLLFFLISQVSRAETPLRLHPANIQKVQSISSIDLSMIRIPEQIGEIQETFLLRSVSRVPWVILIQDAHAIPEAQKNIQKLINYFQTAHGINVIALEGAASEIDPQIFKSFPDKRLLRDLLDDYYEKGELTGGNAAAILNDTASQYHGIEDWDLYEQGLSLYLEAMKKEERLGEKLRAADRQMQEEKEKIYSKPSLKIDKILRSFQRNESDLMETLKALAEVKAPEKGSELALLLEETKNENKYLPSLEREVKEIAEQTLMVSDAPRGSDATLFNQKYQAYRTSEMSAAEFALYLKERRTDSEILPVSFSPRLLRLIETQKTLRELEGTKLFRDFEQYAQSVKESLFRNNAERDLDRESRRLHLLDKLAKLELSREEWEEIREEPFVKRETEFKDHIAFYLNSENREQAFFKNLNKLMAQSASRDTIGASLFIAGGFHTEGLTKQFKDAGISYVVVRPRINQIPEDSQYRKHMNGNVS